jgi:hypothetical protein
VGGDGSEGLVAKRQGQAVRVEQDEPGIPAPFRQPLAPHPQHPERAVQQNDGPRGAGIHVVGEGQAAAGHVQ